MVIFISVLQDNRILRLAPFPRDLRIYIYNQEQNSWVESGTRTNDPNNPHSNPQISPGIRAILESRRTRNWLSPTIRTRLNNLNARQHTDGTWLYYGNDQNAHGDSIYLLIDGKILMLSANANNMGVHVYAGNGWTQIGTRGTGQNNSVTFTPNNNNTYNNDEIIQGIQSILQSRRSRNWRSGQDIAATQAALRPAPITYERRIVMPTRMSTAICHNQQNQNNNGFRLSLTGYDPATDYSSLLQGRNRRNNLLLPVTEQAGQRRLTDEQLQLIQQWIENGRE